jgi:hypothetical protein
VYIGTTATSVPFQWRNVTSGSVDVIGLAVDPPFESNVTPPFVAFAVAPGDVTRPFTFTFSPRDVGVVTDDGNLQLQSGSSQFVVLGGEGVVQMSIRDLAVGSGRDLVAGKALDFGTVALPGGERLLEFRLTNVSATGVNVNGAFVKGGPVTPGTQPPGPFFLVAPTPPFMLPASDSAVVAVVFRPTVSGVFTDAIEFTDAANPASRAGTSLIGRAE